MYQSFYSLNEKPFTMTSNPSFLFLSQQHQEALSALVYGIQERVGFIEMTGEVGTGKTTLCRALLNRLDERVKTAFIFNSDLSGGQLIQTIVEDLGMKASGKDRANLFSMLNRFLIDQLRIGHNVVVIIDEAQNLSHTLLEQIRMLSNLEAENQKLIQIVLVGQPELHEKLKDPSLRQLRQRITVRHHIRSLGQNEVALYIEHRLKIAGANGGGPVFERPAIDFIFQFSGGIPRLINSICDKALLLGFAEDKKKITRPMVERCAHEIEGGVE